VRYLKHWALNFAAWVGLYVVYATGASFVDDKPFWGYGGPAWILPPMAGLAAVTAVITQQKPKKRPRSGRRR